MIWRRRLSDGAIPHADRRDLAALHRPCGAVLSDVIPAATTAGRLTAQPISGTILNNLQYLCLVAYARPAKSGSHTVAKLGHGIINRGSRGCGVAARHVRHLEPASSSWVLGHQERRHGHSKPLALPSWGGESRIRDQDIAHDRLGISKT
jgi:hypothetical protein